MTLFQGGTIDTEGGQLLPGMPDHHLSPDRSVRGPQAARTIAAPIAIELDPTLIVADPLGLVVEALVPNDRAAQAQLAQTLTALIETRIVDCRRTLIRSRLATLAPELSMQLETGRHDDSGLLRALLAELNRTVALALLAEHDPSGAATSSGVIAGPLLHDPAPALQEAALDALLVGDALDQFDRHCRSLCMRQLVQALDQLPLAQSDRHDRSQDLAGSDAATASPSPPQHQDADEAALLAALRRGDHRGAILVLAAAALVPVESVDAAIALRSRRGLVSLAWKAGYSMRAAVVLQSQLAAIRPDAVLVASPDGSCPLSRNEMVWQIGFLARKLS